ncbi:MAG: hypothetical protein ACR2JY_16130 [Chloroflexota bacterium]
MIPGFAARWSSCSLRDQRTTGKSFVVAYAGALLLSSTTVVSSALMMHVLTHGGLAAAAGLVHGLASFIRQQEQLMAGLSKLEQTGVEMADGTTREHLYCTALQAALALVDSPMR